jgi:hypothetical protein
MRRWPPCCLVLLLCLSCASSDSKKSDAVTQTAPETVRLGLEPVKVDLLFVFDPYGSGCQDRRLLSLQMRQFAQDILSNPLLDVQAGLASIRFSDVRGELVTKPLLDAGLGCAMAVNSPCLGAPDCEKEFGPGWKCMAYPAEYIYNFNGSVKSRCTLTCDDDSVCLDSICPVGCSENASCLSPLCGEVLAAPWECAHAGEISSGCLPGPDNDDCPSEFPSVLAGEDLKYLQCAMEFDSGASALGMLEEGLKTAWYAVDPEGPNAAQAELFVRPDAHLLTVFSNNQDDCSIDEDFCAPNWVCDSETAEKKCLAEGGTCKLDVAFSFFKGEETKLCCGVAKKDYWASCPLFGDFKGQEHHELAYEPTKEECHLDEDCEDGWYCDTHYGSGKCRPAFYSFNNVSDFVKPMGVPLFSLASLQSYYDRFMTLKSEPGMLHVRSLVGDARIFKSDAESMISDKCLGEAGSSAELEVASKLDKCVVYKELASTDVQCNDDPLAEGCPLCQYGVRHQG